MPVRILAVYMGAEGEANADHRRAGAETAMTPSRRESSSLHRSAGKHYLPREPFARGARHGHCRSAVPLPSVFVILAGLLLSACGINTIPTYEEQAKAAWSDVLNQYQRRADLIPNLVETVKGYAKQEQTVLTAGRRGARQGDADARSPPTSSPIRRSLPEIPGGAGPARRRARHG